MSVSARQQQAECDKLSNLIFHSSEEEDEEEVEDSADDRQSAQRLNARPQLIHSHHTHPSLLRQSIMRVQ
jgi:hypothetical protein